MIHVAGQSRHLRWINSGYRLQYRPCRYENGGVVRSAD